MHDTEVLCYCCGTLLYFFECNCGDADHVEMELCPFCDEKKNARILGHLHFLAAKSNSTEKIDEIKDLIRRIQEETKFC